MQASVAPRISSAAAVRATSKSATLAPVAWPIGRSRSSGFHGRSWGGTKAFISAKAAHTPMPSSHSRFQKSAKSRFMPGQP